MYVSLWKLLTLIYEGVFNTNRMILFCGICRGFRCGCFVFPQVYAAYVKPHLMVVVYMSILLSVDYL